MDALLQAILTAPDDDAPRLVWADREGGERGELVVLQCSLAQGSVSPPDRLRMAARVHELLSKRGPEWDPLRPLVTTSPGQAFVRGFVEHAAVEIAVLGAQTEALFERSPLLRSLQLEGTCLSISDFVGPGADETWAGIRAQLTLALARLPAGKITALSATTAVIVHGDWSDPSTTFTYGDDFVKLLADTPGLQGLRALSLPNSGVSAKAIPDLARLPRLEELSLDAGTNGAALLAQALARRP